MSVQRFESDAEIIAAIEAIEKMWGNALFFQMGCRRDVLYTPAGEALVYVSHNGCTLPHTVKLDPEDSWPISFADWFDSQYFDRRKWLSCDKELLGRMIDEVEDYTDLLEDTDTDEDLGW